MGSKRNNSIVIRDEPEQEESRRHSSRIAALEAIKGKKKANYELEEGKIGKTDSKNDDKDYSPTEKKINDDEKALQQQIPYQEGQHSQTSNLCDNASGIKILLKFEFTLLETCSRTEFPNEQRQTRDFLNNFVAEQSEQEDETRTLNLFPLTSDPWPVQVPSMLGAEYGQNDPATTFYLGRRANNDVLRLGDGTQNNTLKNKHGGAAASSSKERGPKPKNQPMTTREMKFGEIPTGYYRSFPFRRLQKIIAPPSPGSSHMEERLVQIPDLNRRADDDDDAAAAEDNDEMN